MTPTLATMQLSLWLGAPFVALLGAIALAPLALPNWWARHFGKVTFTLAAITVAFYLGPLGSQARVIHTAFEYLSFICLVGSLFVISGGIHIQVKGEATPTVNVVYLFAGTLVANVVGTTGASMLLIRPWLRMNKYRLTAHHIVFFIFLISNVGGSLTPVGDPPLFLGFLKGVPFWWVAARCWPMWLVGVGTLLAMFLVVDTLNFHRAPESVRDRETRHEQWRCQGKRNLALLGIVLAAVFIPHPPFLRESLMVAAAVVSYLISGREVHQANDFSLQPLKEVAILFAGIFATMMPALDWLQANAGTLGQPSAGFFYWGSGSLSSVLDNAPTYLSFLSAEFGTFISTDAAAAVVAYVKAHGSDLGATAGAPYSNQICLAVAALRTHFGTQLQAGQVTMDQVRMALVLNQPGLVECLQAISIGSVFFGANTYIGNGPNLLVKAIADQQKAHTPSFVGYIVRFTLPFMLPMLLLVWWFFFKG